MDKKRFFDEVRGRLFGNSLTGGQVSGLDLILDEASRRGVLSWHLAYILSTVYWETAGTFQPIAEYGKGKGKKYGVRKKYSKAPYGRGYVQLTWDDNYEKADAKLGLNGALLKNFDLALDPNIAVKILFEGMKEGWFTGKSLDDYIDNIDESDKEDLREFTNARRIINGTDKQIQIGEIALKFERALLLSGYATQVTEKPVEKLPEEKAADVPETTEPSVRPSVSALELIIKLLKFLFGRK